MGSEAPMGNLRACHGTMSNTYAWEGRREEALAGAADIRRRSRTNSVAIECHTLL